MKKLVLFLSLPALLFIASCSKQPVACIKVSKTSVEIGETLNFESCASDASNYEWDFGDGTTATTQNASHSWNTPGVYIVQLRVTSKNKKKADRYSVAITVKGYTRYITKIVLKGFSAKKPDNSDWDGGAFGNPAPEVFVRLTPADGGGDVSTPTKNNITTADLPHTWNLSTQNIYLSNQNWTIELRDDDSLGSTFISELMSTWTTNLATAGSNGVISLTNSSGYSLEIHYENRQ
ncbi:MAG: PKD domain-containing protein [Chitinophagales bacterium]|nr:PKD domain-containing protein [Chitinophagales bacterium]MDW8418305.1 PKD domain-containing protein [Chitinophagales bacterium]